MLSTGGVLSKKVIYRMFLLCFLIQLCNTLFAQEQLLPVYNFHRIEGLGTEEIRSRVVRDHQGYIWIGTLNGLSRYDGYGIKEYRHDPDDPHSLSSNSVMSMLVDNNNRLWVGTFDTGLSLYDEKHDRFINFIPNQEDSSWYQSSYILDMTEDRDGNIWLATNKGVVRVEIPAIIVSMNLDSLSGYIRFTTYHIGTPKHYASNICRREDGIFIVTSDSGLFLLDPISGSLSHPEFSSTLGHRLNSLILYCAMQDSRGNTWIGTGTDEGLFRIDWQANEVWNHRHKKGKDIPQGSEKIYDLTEDRDGNIWIGSEGGVYLFSTISADYISYLTFDESLSRPSALTSISIDCTGTLWIGFSENGVHSLTQKSRRFPCYGVRNETSHWPLAFYTIEQDRNGNYWLFSSTGILYKVDINTLKILKAIDVLGGKIPIDATYHTFIDKRGIYWCGTWGLGLFRVDLFSSKISNYSREAGLGTDKKINSIDQAYGDKLWISIYDDNLMIFDPGSEKFIAVHTGLDFLHLAICDHLNNIWVASEKEGIVVINQKTGIKDRFRHDPSNPGSLSSDHIYHIYEDTMGRIWISAGNMLDLWDPDTRSFIHYPNTEFKKAFYARPIGSDSKGRIWVRYLYAEGTAALNPSSGVYTNFFGPDGIYDFNQEILPDGRIILLGWGGINIFNPDSINLKRPPPPLVLTRMAINDEPVTPQVMSEGLQLPFSQNVLEFEFAAIDVGASQFIRYYYQLEGLEKEWVSPQNRRYVRYPGLPPGNYIFRVKATSIRNEWPEQEITLSIVISPPWWRTTWAYSAYVLFFIGFLYSGYRLRLRQVELKQRIEMEHFQAKHLAEVDQLKSHFFANISHEFRTPLTLILGPIEKLRSRFTDSESQHSLGMMKRNAHQLLKLINQLLDLSKLEAGAMKLQAQLGNIVSLVKGVAYSFKSSAGLRNIDLRVSAEADEIQMYFDRDKMEKILTNLLANAFKFTADGGRIKVVVSEEPTPNPSQEGNRVNPLHGGDKGMGKSMCEAQPSPLEKGDKGGCVEISISDNGVGIPEDKLAHIFDRFYQVNSSTTREAGGTGIGLALVKELVEMHHGTIRATSQPGVGTEFTVSLPLGQKHLKPEEIVDAGAEEEISDQFTETIPEESLSESEVEAGSVSGDGKVLILIVEDNSDVRHYIRENLPPGCRVEEAADGEAGIEKARETIPDLIISDVMMPKMDGFALCHTLKNDARTSHIPIILLTAKAGSENKIEGLQTGADDYLIKPFEPKELAVRIRNLIEVRQKLRKHFETTFSLKTNDVAISSIDISFLEKIKTLIDEHLSDEQFHLQELSSGVAMSRVQLHRKLTALTNHSPGEFIHFLRLQRAMELLQNDGGTVAEIAYRVGFRDPSYFSKCFHKQFGKSPKAIKKAKGTGEYHS